MIVFSQTESTLTESSFFIDLPNTRMDQYDIITHNLTRLLIFSQIQRIFVVCRRPSWTDILSWTVLKLIIVAVVFSPLQEAENEEAEMTARQ